MTVAALTQKHRGWLPFFFGVGACSWMPHWSCHYYRLETGGSFVVGSWSFSRGDSLAALGCYSLVVILNLVAVAKASSRFWVALISGLTHLAFAGLHAVRVVQPFRFEVLGFQWSQGASVREAVVVGLFGLVSMAVAWRIRSVGA